MPDGQLAQDAERLIKALEHFPEAVSIVSPLRDGSGTLVDPVVGHVNAAGESAAELALADAGSIFRDVTEQHVTAAALRESEERYRALFEHAPEAIVVLDGRARADRTGGGRRHADLRVVPSRRRRARDSL